MNAPYLEEIKLATKQVLYRRDLRRRFFLGTGREVPKWANLREYVATWHMQQQAINAGAKTPKFWRKAVGLDA